MKHPASPLTPLFPALPAKAPFASGQRSLVPHTTKLLNTHSSITCTLLNSLASLFAHAFVCFQSFADSFCKIGGVGYPGSNCGIPRVDPKNGSPNLHNLDAPITTFRINTCISVASKGLYLPLESTLMKKPGDGGGGVSCLSPTYNALPACSTLFVRTAHLSPAFRRTPWINA
jgi:hypothetical protein